MLTFKIIIENRRKSQITNFFDSVVSDTYNLKIVKVKIPYNRLKMNYPAAELRGIKMNFYFINPDAEHRGILMIKDFDIRFNNPFTSFRYTLNP